MGFLQKINQVWMKIGIVQRAILIAMVIACGVVTALLTNWANRPDMRLLYSDLNPKEAGKITDKISERNVEYELRAGGTSIYVPAETVHELRLAMAKDGLPEGDQTGYKIFDKEKIGVSPLVQQMNLTRATQDELAKTIQLIDGVSFARVHIVRPEQTIFATETEPASASVVLQLKPGWRLGMASVSAITNLVAGAVDSLSAENVTVVDSNGNMLTGTSAKNSSVAGANTFMDYKDRVEDTIAGKVQEMLDKVLGNNRSSVKVFADIDMTSQEIMKKVYEKGVPQEETISETSSVSSPGGEEEEPAGPENTQKESNIETKLALPETITKTIEVPGKIVSLSVAAVVDLNRIEPVAKTAGAAQNEEGEQSEAPAEPQVTKIMSVDAVKEIIRNAVGPKLLFGSDGNEQLSVVEAPFSRPVHAPLPEQSGFEKFSKYIEIARQSSMGLLSICALLALWIVTRAGKKASVSSDPGEHSELGTLGLLPPGQGESQPILAMRRHIAGELREKPDQVRQLFSSWLEEEA